MKVYKIAAGVYAANCYIVVDDATSEAMIIDPGGSADELIDFIEKNKFKLKYIILTHGHADHIGGVKEIEEHFDVPIMAHGNEEKLLTDPGKNLSSRMFQQPIEIHPTILLNEGDKFNLGGLVVDILHTPGHTEGGMCIKIAGNLFTGDTLFKNSLGRSDLHGGNGDELIDSIRNKLLVLDDDTIVWPGHGEESTIGEERLFNPFLNN